MSTDKQKLGNWGEKLVARKCSCPKCKKERTLKTLPLNFKCADIVCDFCGYLAQVKSRTVKDVDTLPSHIPGAAWGPQKERMDAGIYFPLYIVLKAERKSAVYYLPVDYQDEEIFVKRKPLSEDAKRAGWQGFNYNLSILEKGIIRRLH